MNVNQDLLCSRAWLFGLLLGFVTLWLAGCSAVPLRSLWALRQLDFWTLDASQVHAWVMLPAGVAAPAEALRVTVKAERGGGSGESAQEVLVLRPRGTALLSAEQRRSEHGSPGAHWVALAFDEQDVQRFNGLRQRLQGWKETDGKVSGRSMSLAVSPALCAIATGNPPPMEKIRLSAWLRWKPGQEPVQVLDGAGLKDLKDDAPPMLPACA